MLAELVSTRVYACLTSSRIGALRGDNDTAAAKHFDLALQSLLSCFCPYNLLRTHDRIIFCYTLEMFESSCIIGGVKQTHGFNFKLKRNTTIIAQLDSFHHSNTSAQLYRLVWH